MRKLSWLLLIPAFLWACNEQTGTKAPDKRALLQEFEKNFKPLEIPGVIGKINPHDNPVMTFTTRKEVENRYLKGLLNLDTPSTGMKIYYYGSLPSINNEKLLVTYVVMPSTGISNWWTLLRFNEKGELLRESQLAYQVIARGFIRNRYARLEAPNHTDVFSYKYTMDSTMTNVVDSNLSVLRIDLQEFDPTD